MKAAIQTDSTAKCVIKSVLFCVVFTVLFVAFSTAKSVFPDTLERLAHGVVGTLAAFLTTFLFLKLDRKRLSDIKLVPDRNTLLKFFAGVLIGVALMGLLAATVLYFSNITVAFNRKGSFSAFLLSAMPLILLAYIEELGFRAYPLQTLKNKTGIRLSIIITSVLFALYHIANGWSVADSFYGPAVWGLIFGLAAIYSNGIAMPTGIHFAANLTTSAFGMSDNEVSIWTVKQAIAPVIKEVTTDWAKVLSSLVLLSLAIICVELYIRRKSPSAFTLTERQ